MYLLKMKREIKYCRNSILSKTNCLPSLVKTGLLVVIGAEYRALVGSLQISLHVDHPYCKYRTAAEWEPAVNVNIQGKLNFRCTIIYTTNYIRRFISRVGY